MENTEYREIANRAFSEEELRKEREQLQEQVRELETQVTTLTIVYIDKLTEIQKECEQLRKQVIMLKENN